MIRIALVEDDSRHVQKITEYLERFRTEKGLAMSVRIFPDGEDIVENYRPEYDIILMDIQMRFLDGMTAARLIREKDKETVLIFLTSMAGYAIQGYEVEALDYILKPVSYDMFAQKLWRAIDVVQRNHTHNVVLTLKDGMVKLDVSEIRYIEARSHRMIYHTADMEYDVRGRLDDLEKELLPYGFFRSNRGYLVNLYHITAVRGDCCLIGGEKLPISRVRKPVLLEKLTEIL
ncbi:MAG: response regulator transcription factor [Clostridia bacterium]|nr:response regulator transcription factor [Clostridia bacterium]